MTTKPFLPHSAEKILEDEFLAVRSRLLDIATVLDRIRRAPGSVFEDERSEKLCQAFHILADDTPHKAEQIQLLFSYR
jgi:hypothetical protein